MIPATSCLYQPPGRSYATQYAQNECFANLLTSDFFGASSKLKRWGGRSLETGDSKGGAGAHWKLGINLLSVGRSVGRRYSRCAVRSVDFF
jgi:hypothetical protein